MAHIVFDEADHKLIDEILEKYDPKKALEADGRFTSLTTPEAWEYLVAKERRSVRGAVRIGLFIAAVAEAMDEQDLHGESFDSNLHYVYEELGGMVFLAEDATEVLDRSIVIKESWDMETDNAFGDIVGECYDAAMREAAGLKPEPAA